MKNIIIDIHVHICPPEIRENRESFLDGEPEFAVIYKDKNARLAGASDLIASMDKDNVDMSVIFGFPWHNEEYYRLNNDYVLDAVKRYPDRLIPFCCLNVDHPRAIFEIKRCINLGAKGIGELAFYSKGLDHDAQDALEPVVNICQEANLPVLLHTNEPIGHQYAGKSPMTLVQLYELLKRYDNTKWILAHMGGGIPFYGFLKKELNKIIANCWFDTAAIPYLYRPAVLKAMKDAVGIDKILFGSDYPLLTPLRYKNEFMKSGLTHEEINAILGENARNFLLI